MFRRLLRPLALALLLAGPLASRAAAEDDDPLAGLSGAKALAYATELAADGMKGRKSGFEGGRLAEDWVQGVMGRIGLDPMDRDGVYLQSFRFGATEVVPPIALAVDGAEAAYRTDFVDLLYSGEGVVEGEVVFVGYGITAKDRDWDDYADLDVRGKVVLAIRGAPGSRETEFAEERQIGWKSQLAADRGAAAFLVVDGKAPVPGTIQEKFLRPHLPALWVSGALADRMLAKHGRTLDDLRRTRDAGDHGRSFATGAKVRVEVHGRFEAEAEGRNALGGIPGRDPDVRDEVILVGAHMDHIGVDPTGQVFNGADDNASGTATLLMLAETLKKNRWRGRRTVVFAAFAGEEQGLVGAYRLVADVPFPFRKIVAVINMDMTGQGKPEVSFGGAEGYPAMGKRMLSFVSEAARSKMRAFRVDKNSDHWPFYERGIPAFFAVTAGDHPNYHQITDDVANLKPECMEAAARVVGEIVVGLAGVREPLSTGRELPGFLLREGARVVEGVASRDELAKAAAAAPSAPFDRARLADRGWSGVVAPLSDAEPGGLPVAWARLQSVTKPVGAEWGIVRRAPDLANAARGARTVLLPRLSCAESAGILPAVLSVYRDLGVRWVDPFDAAKPPTPADRDAILAAAVAAKVVVDLTALPADQREAARKVLGDAPATVRSSDAVGLAALRRALGPKTLVLASGAAVDALLSPEALAAAEDAALAPASVADDDTERLTTVLAAAAADEALDLANPAAPARARVRALLGGSFTELLRRLP